MREPKPTIGVRAGPPAPDGPYQQLVRAWRLAEFIVDRIVKPSTSHWIAFQHRPLLPWGNVVESTEPGPVAWYLDHIDTPLPRVRLSELLRTLRANPAIHRAILAVDHTQTRPSNLDLVLVHGLAQASRTAQGELPRFDPGDKEHECLVELSALLTQAESSHPSPLDDDRPVLPNPAAQERALEELAEVFNQQDSAELLLEDAGFPRSRIPRFTAPDVFWRKVIREARDGVLPGGVRPILEAAARRYSHNQVFRSARSSPRAPRQPDSPQLAEVFQLLCRVELRVLYGEPDVRERSIRALYHVFEQPERLAQALLDFVVHTAAPNVQLHFDVLKDLVLRHFSQRTAPWVPVPAGSPDEEVLLWERDRRGKARTRWLSTKEPGLVVADIPGIYLGSERYLWRWDACSVLVPFVEDFEESKPPDEGQIELLPVQSARLTNVDNDVVLPLGVIEDMQSYEWVVFMDHKVEPLATVGDFFVSWARADAYYGGAHNLQDATFTVLDLQSGQHFALLTDDEKKTYIRTFAQTAKEQVPQARGEFDHETREQKEPDDPALTICRPFYDESYTLRLELQLTFEVCYADTDTAWSDYSASTTVETEDLPQTLARLATAPKVLRSYWDHHLKLDRCGWTRVPTTGRARELLEALARAHHGKRTDPP